MFLNILINSKLLKIHIIDSIFDILRHWGWSLLWVYWTIGWTRRYWCTLLAWNIIFQIEEFVLPCCGNKLWHLLFFIFRKHKFLFWKFILRSECLQKYIFWSLIFLRLNLPIELVKRVYLWRMFVFVFLLFSSWTKRWNFIDLQFGIFMNIFITSSILRI